MKDHLGCVLLLLIAGQSASSQIDSGTIVVFQLVDGKFIIAADSRGVRGGVSNNTECKIAAFRHQVIFASSGGGAFGPFDSKDSTPAWTSTETARSAVSRAILTKQETSTGLANVVADLWAIGMRHNWEATYVNHPDLVEQVAEHNGGGLTNGVFAAAVAGTIAITGRAISFVDGEAVVSTLDTIPCSGRPCASGTTEIFHEYMEGKSARAAREKWSSSPVAKIVKLVSLTITYDPSHGEVGGPIDVAELNSDGSVQWIQRKQNCPRESGLAPLKGSAALPETKPK